MSKFFYFFIFLLVGCGVQVKSKLPDEPSSIKPDNASDAGDNFDKAGKSIASGSRWTWNESKKAYEWTFSDKNKKKAKEAWQSTKDYITKE